LGRITANYMQIMRWFAEILEKVFRNNKKVKTLRKN
jgi:hypothetical protein